MQDGRWDSSDKEHLKSDHNVAKTQENGCYECKICLKNFQHFNHLQSHWAMTHKKNCDHCKKSYVDYENDAGKEKSKKCNPCGKTFNTFLKLRIHLEGAHVIDYKCDYCKVIPRNTWSYFD